MEKVAETEYRKKLREYLEIPDPSWEQYGDLIEAKRKQQTEDLEENSLDLEWLCNNLHHVEAELEYLEKIRVKTREHIQNCLDQKGLKSFEYEGFSYKQYERTITDCSQLYSVFGEKLDLFVDAPKISWTKVKKLFDEGNITALEYETAKGLIKETFETSLRVERIKK